MKAGRELDTLIAQFAMKLDYIKEVGGNIFVQLEKGGRYFDVPHYSTDISDAWQVVEKMKEFEFVTHVDIYSNHYTCEVCKIIENSHNFMARQSSETAPLAICLASLKAKGIDIDAQ